MPSLARAFLRPRLFYLRTLKVLQLLKLPYHHRCARESVVIACVSKKHTNLPRPTIAGMLLVVERPHNKYGSAILIQNDLKVNKIYERVQGTVEIITIVMPGVVVHSVYKPPNDPFVLPALGHRNLPYIVIDDFNSHSTTWGYTSTYNEEEAVEQWPDSCDFTLLHYTKLPKSFNSARWKKRYNPDLIASQTCVRSRSWTIYTTPHHLC